MSNWIETKYVFTGSKEEISKFNEIIDKVFKEQEENSWWGGINLDYIVKELNEDPNEVDCRGTIINPKLLKNKTTLKFTTMTKSHSCYELFEIVCKKFSTLQYYFVAQEPSIDIYETNDKEKKYFKCGKKYKYMSKKDIQREIKVLKKFYKEWNEYIQTRFGMKE